ncbi:hypothetical protein ABZ915_05560 [Streptomyces sp. NPDC046915]|uniref:hypothetical protein n=1 Tax=Streptomyces sp. NPDC046915 TaxID=3155257 RepID=UPI003406EFEF
MAGELQRALRERRERQELERVLRGASRIVTGHASASVDPPEQVIEAVRSFWDMSTEPAATLSDQVPQERLNAWVEALLLRYGFHTSALLYTGLERAPWIEFRMPRDWFVSVRQAKDSPWVFLANDLSTVAAVTEQEYQFEFFVERVGLQ